MEKKEKIKVIIFDGKILDVTKKDLTRILNSPPDAITTEYIYDWDASILEKVKAIEEYFNADKK